MSDIDRISVVDSENHSSFQKFPTANIKTKGDYRGSPIVFALCLVWRLSGSTARDTTNRWGDTHVGERLRTGSRYVCGERLHVNMRFEASDWATSPQFAKCRADKVDIFKSTYVLMNSFSKTFFCSVLTPL